MYLPCEYHYDIFLCETTKNRERHTHTHTLTHTRTHTCTRTRTCPARGLGERTWVLKRQEDGVRGKHKGSQN